MLLVFGWRQTKLYTNYIYYEKWDKQSLLTFIVICSNATFTFLFQLWKIWKIWMAHKLIIDMVIFKYNLNNIWFARVEMLIFGQGEIVFLFLKISPKICSQKYWISMVLQSDHKIFRLIRHISYEKWCIYINYWDEYENWIEQLTFNVCLFICRHITSQPNSYHKTNIQFKSRHKHFLSIFIFISFLPIAINGPQCKNRNSDFFNVLFIFT